MSEEYSKKIYEELEKINRRPRPFEFYTAAELWTDEYTSKRMLAFHLNKEIDVSSRRTDFIQKSVDWITAFFRIGKGTKIADFGCGPGLYAFRLARRQADVTGIDFSRRSIQYAREAADRENLSIRYVHQNYLEYETDDRFHLILMIMCDFCALSPVQRKQMLEKFHSLLEPAGSLLLDVYSLKAFDQRKEAAKYEINLLDKFWSPDKYYGFFNTFKYEEEKVLLDKYTIIEAGRIRTVYNWLQHFSQETLEKELRECGFRVERFYADVAGTPFDPESPEFAAAAKKR